MSPPQAPEPVIDVQDLWKSFAGFGVLKGINLKMMEGTTTVVLGGSGSGKTVLMKHIMGLFKPDRGQVIVDGQNVSTMGRQELAVFRERMGMVFQSSALFDSMTVGDNVAFPLREHNTGMSEKEICTRSNRSSPPSCPGACASASDLRVPSFAIPRSCFMTNRPPGWIRSRPRASTR